MWVTIWRLEKWPSPTGRGQNSQIEEMINSLNFIDNPNPWGEESNWQSIPGTCKGR